MERINIRVRVGRHYLGQTHTVPVPLPVALQGNSLGLSESMVQSAFEAAYLASFSRLLPGVAMQIVSLRVARPAVIRRSTFRCLHLEPSASVERARLGSRPVWFEGGWRDTAVWARLELPAEARIVGPAVLEQPDATTVIEPGLAGRIDQLGNLIVEPA